MPVTLHELSVQSYLQILPASINLLNKAREHFGEEKLDELLELQMVNDMLPLAFQIRSIRHHSMGAVEGLLQGEFKRPPDMEKMDFHQYVTFLNNAKDSLDAIEPDQLNALSGKPMNFVMGDTILPFTAEGFILSFSLPNFNFHSATLYNLLRREGLPIGKIDYLGKLRINTK